MALLLFPEGFHGDGFDREEYALEFADPNRCPGFFVRGAIYGYKSRFVCSREAGHDGNCCSSLGARWIQSVKSRGAVPGKPLTSEAFSRTGNR